MRIVFMGTPEFAVPSLQALVENGFDVVGVITQPDKPKGRGGKVQQSPVKEYALSKNIPVFQPLKIRNELEMLQNLKPDYCVTAAFGQILSQAVLDISKATINVHGSLLPKHRGAAPAQWAILQGDAVTGITTMFTDKGIDTGKMLLKAECAIEPTDTAGSLLQKLSVIGANLLIQTLKNIETIVPIEQNEAEFTYDPMLKKEMGEIDFTKPAEYIERQVRAMQPWPKAYITSHSGLQYKITQAKVLQNSSKEPGTVVFASSKQGLIVATATKDIQILRMQAPNKKEMDAAAYLLGKPMQSNIQITQALE
ncbi:MAG: methionyl-tRNA formyltransferase [Eubacteriales bacterium]|nr:methionyl-tRNA formyltransferase [Eubacteriales bacterium]